MKKRIIGFLGIFILASSFFFGQEKNHKLVAIRGAQIVPVVGQDIPDGIILIKDRLIEAVGKDIPIPKQAEIIDAKGLMAYPGLIDSYCYLGLSEISGVQATVDSRETGRLNPQVRTSEALRYDSMHIPIARSNGITAALVVPAGGVISGQSSLIRLTGWANQEMVIKNPAAMHIEFPQIPRRAGVGMMGAGPRAVPENTAKIIEELKALFKEARFYQKRKEAAARNLFLRLPEFDETLESLLPVVRGELPVMASVHADKDIKAVIQFVKDENLKAIFYAAEQGWKVAEDIKKANIPVVFGSLYALPPVWEDGYDSLFRNPGVLNKAGVKIAFSSASASLAKDLPYHAAKAAAFGLDKREALKAVTIYPAEIFGVEKIMGSIEEGKVANIVLADGDILEFRTNIKYVFIDGKETDLSNRYTELLEKFKKRN